MVVGQATNYLPAASSRYEPQLCDLITPELCDCRFLLLHVCEFREGGITRWRQTLCGDRLVFKQPRAKCSIVLFVPFCWVLRGSVLTQESLREI